MDVVQKPCPDCGATVGWPANVTEVDCWNCKAHLTVARPFRPPSKFGQQVMVVGLAIVALGVVLAVLSAL